MEIYFGNQHVLELCVILRNQEVFYGRFKLVGSMGFTMAMNKYRVNKLKYLASWSPTTYMLWSIGFSLLIKGIFKVYSSHIVGIFLEVASISMRC